MSRMTRRGWLALGALAAAPGAAVARSAEEEVQAGVQALAAAFEAGDADGVMAVTSRDMRLIHPTRGDATFEPYAAAVRVGVTPERRPVSVAAEITDLKLFGDIALVEMTWRSEARGRDGATVRRGERDLEAWRREADGRWRLYRGASFPVPV